MIVDLTRLFSRIDKEVLVDEIYSFTELEGTGVTSIDNVSINGVITLNALNEIRLNFDVEGVMIIPCAITLKPVEYPFSIKIEGDLEEIAEENPEKYINSKNSLDILPIIWENILMEIPMRVVSEEAKESDIKMEGNGWKFVTEEEEKTSPLSELMDYLDDSEVK